MNKKKVLLFMACSFLIIGMLIGWLSAQPKRTIQSGKVYEISPRYSLAVWFHENGVISETYIREKTSDQLVSNDIFYENGFLRTYHRKTLEGSIQESFLPDGTLRLRKYYKGEFLDRSEYYNKEGQLEKMDNVVR